MLIALPVQIAVMFLALVDVWNLTTKFMKWM